MASPTIKIPLLLLLAACRSEPLYQGYEGDGSFVDHGPRAAIRRYVIDLGELDLTVAGRREFAMAGLPPEEFTLGLQVRARVEPEQPAVWGTRLFQTRPIPARVRLELAEVGGVVVFAKEAPLHEWTWSGSGGGPSDSFVYWRGDPGDSSTPPGSSSFRPLPGGRYRVAFSVLHPDPAAANYVVLARAFGGGWKVQERD